MTLTLEASLDFELPPELEAAEPPEVRGTGRDDVGLLASWRSTGAVAHHRFTDLPELLDPGDVVVLNTSITRPAAVPATDHDGRSWLIHFSTELPTGLWLVEPRRRSGHGTTSVIGEIGPGPLCLDGGATVELLTPGIGSNRLWVATLALPEGLSVDQWLDRVGQPIRYAYAGRDWPVEAYRTVYGTEPGSAEMPSAGRPFTPALLTALLAGGIDVAPLVLHTGVSSLEGHETPPPERFRVSGSTARRVTGARADGGRVVAIGTTVVRALETVTDEQGRVHPGDGWTEEIITPERGVRAVDGLLTGWHEPRASHLLMLEAVGGRPLLDTSYRAALDGRYRWHEFGDLHLILP